MTTLGLVHIVRTDQNGDAARGQSVQLVPEVTPRLGIDARRRLVQQQELRLVQQARRERETLLPAAGQCPCKLVGTLFEPEVIEGALDSAGAIVQPVHAGDEA